MSIGDERVIVDVKDVEDGAILYTDKEGKQATYYPSHSIRLVVEMLEVQTVLNESQAGAEPPVSTRVRGTAALEDSSISVVGDPKSRVHKLTITLIAGDWKPSPVEPKEGGLRSVFSELGGAMLGFNRADWEIGNDDEWWLSCYLPKSFIDALIADVRSGQLNSVNLSLSLRGLYTSSHVWEPVSSRGDLFIRPDRRDNSLATPDMAQGHVWSIHFTSAPRDLRRPEPVEPFEPEDQGAPSVATPDPVANAIIALSVRVDQMRSTLKWIGGFVVVALLFVASR